MSRSKRFVTGLLSSYAAIGVNILYTLASVPLALHYLNKEEFGLWALVTQVSGYLMLLEFGMTGSVARSLSDHKDQIQDGIYGSILRTGSRVLAIQGALVALMGLPLAWFVPLLLDLPSRLHHPFAILMAVQAVLSGLRLALGALGSPLWCHQRLDLSNLSSSLGLIGTFVVLWIGFRLGWHVYSLTISTIVGSFLSSFSLYIFCRRLGLYPPREHRGCYEPRLFRELFHYGGGLFMMNLGAQLASASQVIVVSRMLGMEAATTWSVATKVFVMAQQFVARVLDSSAGGLAEMFVRKEAEQLQKRFRELVAISAVMAVAASSGVGLMNGAFVEFWTSGRVTWAPWNNYLLAWVMFSSAVTRCHVGLVGISKQIRGMKFVYLIEGVAFICLSVLLVPQLGLAGLLLGTLACNIGITGIYGMSRTASYFGVSRRAVAGWVARPLWILLMTAALCGLTRIPALVETKPLIQFFAGGVIFCVVVIPSLWFFGMNPILRFELQGMIAKMLGKAKAKLNHARGQ